MTESSRLSRRSVLAGLSSVPFMAGAPPSGHGSQPNDRPGHSPPTLLRGAELVLTMDPDVGDGPLGTLRHADVLMRYGRIAAVGRRLPAPQGTRVLDMSGRMDSLKYKRKQKIIK